MDVTVYGPMELVVLGNDYLSCIALIIVILLIQAHCISSEALFRST